MKPEYTAIPKLYASLVYVGPSPFSNPLEGCEIFQAITKSEFAKDFSLPLLDDRPPANPR